MTAEPVAGSARYVSLALRGEQRVSDALSHLCVLIPALDAYKHYWFGHDELEILLAKAGDWLASHPQKEVIARRYLNKRRSLVKAALARLAPEELEEADAEHAEARRLAREEALEAPLQLMAPPMNRPRYAKICAMSVSSNNRQWPTCKSDGRLSAPI